MPFFWVNVLDDPALKHRAARSSRDLKEKQRETLETKDDTQKRLNSSMLFVFCSVVLSTVVTC